VTLASLLELAEAARARGAWDEALTSYKAALLVAETNTAARASIYARVGDVKERQGKTREAELYYEKALDADGGHRGALDALVELATRSKEPRRAIDWRRRRLQAASGPDERAAELLAIAHIHSVELGDGAAAVSALEEAHAIAPRNRAVADALLEAHEARQQWSRVVDLTSEIAELTLDRTERRELRFAAADRALAALHDEARGLALLERALDDDPTNDRALSALVAVRGARGEWIDLDATLTSLAERFAQLGDGERAWDACCKLGALRRDRIRDLAGAIEALGGALRCKPGDVESRAMIADLHVARGDEAQAVAELERAAELAPERAATFARLFTLHRGARRTDRAWLAATALEELGAADLDQQIVADQYRTRGPIRPHSALDDTAWDQLLRAPGADDVVADVLRAISDAAVAVRVGELRERKELILLDRARLQGAASTVSAVRSFQWASKVLGVAAPDLYVLDEVPGGIAAVQAAAPSTALGPDVLRGLTTQDLAFLAGRHMTYYRPEHYALIHYPTIPDLSVLFLASVKVALPELPVPPHLSDAVSRRCKLLARHLDDASTERLEAAVGRLEARDGRADLAAWVKGVELTAQRAGLLLCGDVLVACARLRAESRAIADLSLEEKRGDLLAFCASAKLARARDALAVGALPSVRPPERERQAG
jgi:tetratricopeptide (TPR) repeat protein